MNNMSREELAAYLTQFVDVIEQNWDLSEEEEKFITLHKMILSTLQHDRIYKVCYREAYRSAAGEVGVREYHAQYFSSLNEAKRELRRRAKKLFRHPCLAHPDQIQELGIRCGVAPKLTQSIITNTKLPALNSGRQKLYEARLLSGHQIIPVQAVLSSVYVAPPACPEPKRPGRTASLDPKNLPKVIPFSWIQQSGR